MKKARTKFLSLLLALCMVISMIPVAAFAADGTPVSDSGSLVSGSVYELVTSLTAGSDYLIVNANSGSGYAMTRNGSSLTTTDVQISNGTITVSDATNMAWTISGSSSATIENGNYYLRLSNNSATLNASSSGNSARNTVNASNGAFSIYRSGNNGTYRLSVSSSAVTANTTTSNVVYLFKYKETASGEAVKLTVDPGSTELYVEDTKTLTPTVEVDGTATGTYAITWGTSNAAVATVNNGVVTAVGAGTANITATLTSANNTAVSSSDPVVVTIPVTVSAVALESLTLEGTATIQTCLHKSNFSGVTGIATYSDGSTKNLTAEDMEFTYTNEPGSQVVTATYEGKTATFKIAVEEEVFKSGTVGGTTSFTFAKDGNADFSGLQGVITYECGCTETVEAAELEVTGYDLTTAGEQTATVTYNGNNIGTVTVNVVEGVSGSGNLAGKITYVLDDDGVINSGEKYIIANLREGIYHALENNSGSDNNPEVTVTDNTITLTNDSTLAWVITQSDGNNYYIENNGQYVNVADANDVIGNSTTLYISASGDTFILRAGSNSGNYLRYSPSSFWCASQNNSNNAHYLFYRQGVETGAAVTFTVSPATVSMQPETIYTLTGVVTADGQEYDLSQLAEGDITWSSSNEDIATVSGGVITSGTTEDKLTVTATLNSVNGVSLVNPIKLEIPVTVQSKQLDTDFTPVLTAPMVSTELNVEPDFSGVKLTVKFEGDENPTEITTADGLVITESYDITNIGTYICDVTYIGTKYGSVIVKVTGDPYAGLENATDYPEYPEDGAVRIRKTATELNFDTTGVVEVELDVAGISYKTGVDVVLVVDISNSMAWSLENAGGNTDSERVPTDDQKTKLEIAMESASGFADILLKDNTGAASDNTLSFVTFAGYDTDLGEPDDKGNYADALLEVFRGVTSVSAAQKSFAGTKFTNHTTSYPIQVMNDQGTVISSGNNRGDTNYDYAFYQALKTVESIKNDNTAAGNADRDVYVVFMTDGAPSHYNHYTKNGDAVNRQDLVPERDRFPAKGANYDFSHENESKDKWYSYFSGEANVYATDLYDAVNGNFFAVGFDLSHGGFTVDEVLWQWDESELVPALQGVAYHGVEDKQIDVYATADADDLIDYYKDMANAIKLAGTSAQVNDVVDSDFTLQMDNITGSITTDANGVESGTTADLTAHGITPHITVQSYDLWTKTETTTAAEEWAKEQETTPTDAEITAYINKLVGTRKEGVNPTVLEKVTFNADGTEAYSEVDGVKSGNIMTINADGSVVIAAKTFTYTKTADGVESFDWLIGNITDDEITLSFIAYLKGSLEGEEPNGLKYTNEEATLEYIDINNKHATKEFPVPAVAWGGASTAYEFYLVNEQGQPCDRNGVVVPFANRIVITGPYYEELYLNQGDENEAEVITAAYVLPFGYVLYDETASYTVLTASGDNQGKLTISDPASGKVQTTIVVSAIEPSYIQSHVAFGVMYNQIPTEANPLTPDTVVIDYGKAIDINISNSDDDLEAGYTAELIGFVRYYEDVNLSYKYTATSSTTPYESTYGTFSIVNNGVDVDGVEQDCIVRYTPTDIVDDVEMIICVIKMTNEENANDVYYMADWLTVIPATNVHYETDFATGVFTTSQVDAITTDQDYGKTGVIDWRTVGDPNTVEAAADDIQNDGTIGVGQTYGYDTTYDDDAYFSDGSSIFVEGEGYDNTYTTFSFVGTGFELYSRTGADQGMIRVQIYSDAAMTEAKLEKTVTVLNKSESNLELYQIPVVSVNGLTHGTHYVKVDVQNGYENKTGIASLDALNRGNQFYFDAIRVYDPAKGDTVAEAAYNADGEANTKTDEVRHLLLTADTFNALATGDSAEGMVFVDSTYTGNNADHEVGDVEILDYAKVGPNNEVYLDNGQAIAFQITANSVPASIDVGAKAITGAAAKLNVVVSDTATSTYTVTKEIKSSSAQYINLMNDSTAAAMADKTSYVVITNTGDGVLSITDIKVAYSNATAAAASEDYGIAVASETELEDPYAVSYTANAATFAMARSVLTASAAAPEEPVPEETTPEATEPEATEPEATEPEVTEPEVTEPEATEPEVTEPEATEPEATEPENSYVEQITDVINKIVSGLSSLLSKWFK